MLPYIRFIPSGYCPEHAANTIRFCESPARSVCTSMFALVFLQQYHIICVNLRSFHNFGPMSHIVVKHLQQSWLHWVPDNNYLQSWGTSHILCYLFWCFIASSCGNKGSCLQRELNVGHLSYFACKHCVESPCPILAEVTHQLLISPCFFILDENFKVLTHTQSNGHFFKRKFVKFLRQPIFCFGTSSGFSSPFPTTTPWQPSCCL